jgi:hypothetical protein
MSSKCFNGLLVVSYDRVGERIVMLAGILFLLLGPVALYPYSGPPPQFRCNGTCKLRGIITGISLFKINTIFLFLNILSA